jgi:RNA polymerase sigma-70 factor (ECF subfamily)
VTLAAGMSTFTPERLVQEAQAYSQAAWAEIYDQYYPKIVGYCYHRTSDRSASEDLASEVFLEALRGIRRYQYRGVPLSAWLYRIARNLTADHLKRSRNSPTVSLSSGTVHNELVAPDRAEAGAQWHEIHASLRQLTDDQQQVIILRFFHDLSHEDTAAIMGRRPGAVRVLQSRALQALRRVMGGGAGGR